MTESKTLKDIEAKGIIPSENYVLCRLLKQEAINDITQIREDIKNKKIGEIAGIAMIGYIEWKNNLTEENL